MRTKTICEYIFKIYSENASKKIKSNETIYNKIGSND